MSKNYLDEELKIYYDSNDQRYKSELRELKDFVWLNNEITDDNIIINAFKLYKLEIIGYSANQLVQITLNGLGEIIDVKMKENSSVVEDLKEAYELAKHNLIDIIFELAKKKDISASQLFSLWQNKSFEYGKGYVLNYKKTGSVKLPVSKQRTETRQQL